MKRITYRFCNMSNTVYDVYLREIYDLSRLKIRWNELIIREANNDFCNVKNSVCTVFMSVKCII